MLSLFRTLHFFKNLVNNSPLDTPVTTVKLAFGANIVCDTDIYQPRGKYYGSIIFFHGMNKYGKNDARVEHFCRCLADIGFRVIVPSYPIICQHIFDLSSIDEFEQTLLSLTEDKTLCPSGKIAIFTVSLSGTLAIRAAGRAAVKNKISAFFTIGSGFYVNRVFRLGFERIEQDSYMKMICVKNVLRDDPSTTAELIQAVDVAIDDAFMSEEPNRLPALLPQLTPENQAMMNRIAGPAANTSFLYPIYNDYLTQKEHDLFTSCDNANLNFPIILMHSAKDHVFPPEETIDFCQYLTEQGVQNKMCITTLMEHVNHDFSLKKIPQVLEMFRLFYYYFKKV